VDIANIWCFDVLGLVGFIPKITTRYLGSRVPLSMKLYGMLLAVIALFVLNIRPDIHPKGIVNHKPECFDSWGFCLIAV